MKPWFPFRSRTRYDKSEGVNEAWIIDCKAVGKTNDNHRYMIANEWIAANIAQFMRLPIPPFALLRNSATTAMFGSYSFEGDTLPYDVRAPECVNGHAELCAGILVFDILVANCDRHRGNIKVDNPNKPKRVYIIDHDHALFYVLPDEGIKRLKELADRLGISGGSVSGHHRHILLDEVTTAAHFSKWIERANQIPNWFINDVCDAVKQIGLKKGEAKEVKKFLLERRSKIGNLILDNRKEFTKIKDWPLFI